MKFRSFLIPPVFSLQSSVLVSPLCPHFSLLFQFLLRFLLLNYYPFSLIAPFCHFPFPSSCLHSFFRLPNMVFFRFYFFVFDLYFLISSRKDQLGVFHCRSSGNDCESPAPHSDLPILILISAWFKNTEFISFRNGRIFSNIEFSSQGPG